MSRLDRRRFLALAGSVLGLVAVSRRVVLAAPLEAGPRATEASDVDGHPRSVETLVSGGEGVRRIGAAYLAATPEERDASALFDAILAKRPDLARASRPRALRAAFARAVRHDFAVGDVVVLDGWRLARTEARLCALWALEHPV